MDLDKTEVMLLLFLVKQRMTEVEGFEYSTLVGIEQTLSSILEELGDDKL